MNKQMSRVSRLVITIVMAGLVVALDQISKHCVVQIAQTGQLPLTLIPGVMDVSLVYNTGAAFSLGADGSKTLLFAIFSIVVVLAILWVCYREEKLNPVQVIALGCVAGGGIGNLIDRLTQGQVVDFLATTFINFPVFNVADIFVTCGVIVLLISLFLRGNEDEKDDEDE